MSYDQFKELAITNGTYLAALIARMHKVPLAQTQLWNRRMQNDCSYMEA